MSSRTFSPVPTGTVLFITSTKRSPVAGRALMTARTRERSASPEWVAGVSTHTKMIRQRRSTSSRSSVNVSRERLRASSRSTPGS